MRGTTAFTETLDELIRQGREDELYKRLLLIVKKSASRVLFEMPEDFVHEVAAYLTLESRTFKPGKASFATWAYRRAESRAINVLQFRTAKKRSAPTVSIETDVSAVVRNMPDPRHGTHRYAYPTSQRVETRKRHTS